MSRKPPAELERPCEEPRALGRKALSAGAVERFWAADRAALADCGERHGAVVDFYRTRDAQIPR